MVLSLTTKSHECYTDVEYRQNYRPCIFIYIYIYIMKMLHFSKAGPYLDILERIYIFRGTKIEVKRQTYGIYIHDQPLF